MRNKKILSYIRLFFGILWASVLLGGLCWIFSYVLKYGWNETKTSLQTLIASKGESAIFYYLLLFSLRSFLFLPSTALVFLAGMLFDPLSAFFFALIGTTISLSLVYLGAQFLGKEFVQSHENEWFQRIDKTLSQQGFFATLILILLPLLPADSIAIVAGVTQISFLDFFLGILIGSAATVAPFVLLGNSLTHIVSLSIAILSFLFAIIITLWAWNHPHFRSLFQKK
ncbi:TVP38/TMEM64 family protein [Candidatus Peregrinibacteria bacterium]|nr:MAG: TVP38/TMEM64 family protein [Candidatus Peregrinibacteria bacterium]